MTIWSNKLRPEPGRERPDWGCTCCCCWEGGGWVKLGCCWDENVVWYRSLLIIIQYVFNLIVVKKVALSYYETNDFSYWKYFESEPESSEIFLAVVVVFWIWWLELQKSHLSMIGARDKSVPESRVLLVLAYSWIMCQMYFIIFFFNLSTSSINQGVNEKMERLILMNGLISRREVWLLCKIIIRHTTSKLTLR